MKAGYPIITLTSSFCTMSYSMLMASVMMDFTGEEVITQCMTMGPYLLGLGLGSSFGDKVKPDSQLSAIWKLEWLSVILLPLIPLLQLMVIFFFLHFSPSGLKIDSKEALQILLGANALFALLTGILGGAQLPLILKKDTGFSEEKILAINYLGPLLAGFVVVGMAQAALPTSIQIYAIGVVQLFGLFFLVGYFPNVKRSLLLLFVPISILIGAAHLCNVIETLTIKSAYIGIKSRPADFLRPGSILNVLRKYGSVERVKTPYQTIDLFVEPPDLTYSIPGNASIYLNRKPQFDLFSVDVYHQTMIHAAINLLQRKPENVLILGAGDGLLLKEFSSLDGITNITMVELDAKMLEWSRTNGVVSLLNHRILDRIPQNAELIVGDGVSFLRHNKTTRYDLILIDFPFPNGHDLAKLYSLEFYRLAKRSLKDSGLIVLDLPLYMDEEDRLAQESLVIVKTMASAGLVNPLLFGPSSSFVAVSGDGKKLSFDYETFPQGLGIGTYMNFLNPYREDEIPRDRWDAIPVNTMFWPKGL